MNITKQLFIKKIAKSLVILGILAFSSTSFAQVTVDFDDLGNYVTLRGTYKGLNWGSPAEVLDGNADSCSGYFRGIISNNNVAFNGWSDFPWEISYAGSGTTSFNSVYLTAAWNDTMVVKIEGLNGSTVVYTTNETLTRTPNLVTMNWNKLTSIKISFVSRNGTFSCGNTGDHIAMDNLTYGAPLFDSISVTPASGTYTGGVNTNLYIGYPNNTAIDTLKAINGGSATKWSPATYLSCTSCSTTVFSPTAAGSYTITASSGGISKSTTICVKDIRVPNTSGTKAAVYICHLEPTKTTPQTLAVVLRGISGHFQYHKGDKLGVCGNVCATSKRDFEVADLVVDEQYLEVMCTPNPFRNSFKLNYVSHSDLEATISIYGMTGNLMETTTLSGLANEAELGTNLPNGIYTVSFNQGDNKKVFRMIKLD